MILILSVNCSHACIIYVKIYEKISSGGLEVSLSIEKIVGIPMGTNCAPLVADLVLLCYERDFVLSLSDNNQTDIIEALNSPSRYLDDLLNIVNTYFEQMVGQIYPTKLQLNKANSSDTEASFLDLNLP